MSGLNMKKIINASEISNSDDAIAVVWNEYYTKQVPATKYGRYQKTLHTDDTIKLGMSKKISRNLKDFFRTTNGNLM